MRLPQTLFYLFAFITTIHALALPAAFSSIADAGKELYKRKGGGGGGGKGGGGGFSSGGGGRSGSGGSRGGGGGTPSGSGTGGRNLGSSQSNVGGRTVGGSGPRPAYGNNYAGGATVPYRSGTRARGGVGPAPFLLGGAALGFLPGIWLYGAYAYPYGHAYPYHNDTSDRNETSEINCLCGEFQSCGCDNNTDFGYLTQVANNDSIAAKNGSILVINGTLPNGTTAAGGDEPSDGTQSAGSAAGSLKQQALEMSGWWMVIAGVTYTIWFM